MQIKVVKDLKYNTVYDVYYKRWWGWSHQYWLSAGCIQDAKNKVNGKINPPSLTWEI